MGTKRALEQELATLSGFENPQIEREQYVTPADLAAHVIHLATLNSDIRGRTVVDLGTGTGMLAIGAALAGSDRVIGIDLDPSALKIAQENESKVSLKSPIDWIIGDGRRAPICPSRSKITVVMNPPFGAQNTHVHADRAFLETAVELASVSYSFHNRGSESFVKSFASDNDGTVTHSFLVEFPLLRQHDFHVQNRSVIEVELFRIEWNH